MFKNYLKLYKQEHTHKYKEFTTRVPQKESPEIGFPMEFQKTISQIMNGITNVDGLLLMHELGTGKSCTAITAIEKNLADKNFGMKRGLILNKGKSVMNNFINELVTKCTLKYNVGNDALNKRIWSKFYEFNTFEMFSKKVDAMSHTELLRNYNNTLVVIDEVHNLINEDSSVYKAIHTFLHSVPSLKILLLSATPIKDSVDDFVPVINLILPEHNQLDKATWKNVYYTYNAPNNLFKHLLSTKVSYLRAEQPDNIDIVHVGRPMYGLRVLNVVEHRMSPFQNQYYKKAFSVDKTVFNDARQASRFVFPDGTWGNRGYEKFITKGRVVRANFKNFLEELGTDTESFLEQVGQCSVKYKFIIESLLKADSRKEKSLVYDDLITGSGLNTLAALLNFIGFRKYRLLTSEIGVSEIKRIQKDFNVDPYGSKISVLMGSRVISEGLTFNDVSHEHVVPHWNSTETEQIIGRGIRLNSHKLLLEKQNEVSVKVYRHMVVSDKISDSIDYIMYKTSEEKQIEIDKVMNAIKEASLTCEAFQQRNGGKCLYTDNNDEILYNLPVDNSDSPDRQLVQKIIDHFQNGLVKDTFQNITIAVQGTERDTLDTLQYLVENKIPFYRMGLVSYLFFDQDTFYLSPHFDVKENISVSTYVNEFVPNYKLYETNYESVFENAIALVKPNIETANVQRLIEIALTVKVYNIHSQIKSVNLDRVNRILETYKNYYKIDTIDDGGGPDNLSTVCIVSYEEEMLRNKSRRCLYNPTTSSPWNEWTKCPNRLFKTLDLQTINNDRLIEQEMRDKNVKLYGLKHPDSGDFCLKNVTEISDSAASDKRKIQSGKRCINWPKKQLLELINNETKQVNKLNSFTRQTLCDEIERELKEKQLIFESRSCGVQYKRK